eukprot:364912-Chlamydomonas_euryale.AAC.7
MHLANRHKYRGRQEAQQGSGPGRGAGRLIAATSSFMACSSVPFAPTFNSGPLCPVDECLS